MKATKKIVLKQILFLCTLAHTLPVFAVRPIMAKAGVGAVAALAAANVGRSYKHQKAHWLHDDEEKSFWVGSAAVVGLGATGAAAFFLHKRLPVQRLKQAADLRISVRNWRMMNPCSFTNASTLCH
jgi:hypothetical protein